MALSLPTRVRFRAGQPLRTSDLADDQAYFLQQRRRHNIALHTWGVVAGLGVSVSPAGQVTVAPGMAIDGYGRELVLASPRSWPDVLKGEDTPGRFDVWLVFDDRADPDPAGCGPRGAARHREDPQLRLTPKAARQDPDPRKPGDVPSGDLDFTPERPLPDDAGKPWPVFLAEVAYRDTLDAERKPSRAWDVSVAERPNAGLRAETLWSHDPDRDPDSEPGVRTKIQNGTGGGGPPFAVHVSDEDGVFADAPVPVLAAAPEQIALRAAEVAVAGNLVMVAGGAVEFQANRNPTAPPDDLPWQMYRRFLVNEGTDKGPTADYADELRIALPPAASGPASVVFGTFTDKGTFESILIIGNDRRVEVRGNLVVLGTVEARAFKAPTTGGGGASPADVFREIKAFIQREPETRIGLAFDILQDIGAGKLAECAVGHAPNGAFWDAFPAGAWGNPDAVSKLANVENVDEGKFFGFLMRLLSGTAAAPKQLQHLTKWEFNGDGAVKVAAAMPTEKGMYAKLATELVKLDNRPKLMAFVGALIDASNQLPVGDARKGSCVAEALAWMPDLAPSSKILVRPEGVKEIVKLWVTEVTAEEPQRVHSGWSCDEVLKKASETDTGTADLKLLEAIANAMNDINPPPPAPPA